jgi:hypothetical protein
MQTNQLHTQITEHTNNNRHAYQQLHNKLQEVATSSQNDFAHLSGIAGKLPERLDEGDRVHLAKLLNTFDTQFKQHETDLDKVEYQVADMENVTSNFVEQIPLVKGATQGAKHALVEASIEQFGTLREGIGGIREILTNITQLMTQIRSASGIDAADIVRMKQIFRAMLDEERGQTSGMMKNYADVSKIDEHKQLIHAEIQRLKIKCESCEAALKEMKTMFDKVTRDMSTNIKHMSSTLNGLNIESREKKVKMQNISDKIDDEVENLKRHFGNKLKEIESSMNKNNIKRYQ